MERLEYGSHHIVQSLQQTLTRFQVDIVNLPAQKWLSSITAPHTALNLFRVYLVESVLRFFGLQTSQDTLVKSKMKIDVWFYTQNMFEIFMFLFNRG